MRKIGIILGCLAFSACAGMPDGSAASRLKSAAGIAVSADGSLWAADSEAGVVFLLDRAGHVIRSIGEGVLRHPLGAAVDTDGTILVSDSMQNRIHRFSPEGALLKSFGKGFSGAGPLDVAPNRDVYVLDIDHGRVQVYDAEGRFRFAFAEKGRFADSLPGQLYFPGGIAVDERGRVYVSDTHNFRIQVFSPTGEFLRAWGRRGEGPGEFDHPFGLEVHGDRVLVADAKLKLEGGNEIEVFDLQGRHLGVLGRAESPFDVAVGPDGRVAVSEYGAGRIRWFQPGD